MIGTHRPPCLRRGCRALVPAALLIVLSSCGSNVPKVQDPLAHASLGGVSLPPNVGPSDCSPASAATTSDGKIEIEGEASGGGSLWALVFHDEPIPAAKDLRIVWRMNGASRLSLVALGPAGQLIEPTGVVPASGVDWRRPGDPWNSTFRFPAPGCWRISAQRGVGHGDVWIEVV